MIETKEQLLAAMSEMGACTGATRYVTEHASADAGEIWRTCWRLDWLLWFAVRQWPEKAAAFARSCADRAREYAESSEWAVPSATLSERSAAKVEAAYGARRPADLSDAMEDATWSAREAAIEADKGDEEHFIQTRELHAMWGQP